MGERLLCKQEVIGSIPFTSTNSAGPARPDDKAAKPTGVNAGIGTNEFPVHLIMVRSVAVAKAPSRAL